jgi:hypothetical protein
MKLRHLTIPAALAALAAIPATAGATSSSITADCSAVTVSFRAFGPAEQQALAQITTTIDGAPTLTTFRPGGPLSVYTLPLNLTGVHTVSVAVQGTPVNAVASFGPATFTCGTPPAEDVPRPLVPQPVSTVPLTCEELLALYPKAGLKRRVAWGCPQPKVKVKVKRPETCADLRARGVGRKWLVRRGCVVRLSAPPDKPRPPRRPFPNVPVTGEK